MFSLVELMHAYAALGCFCGGNKGGVGMGVRQSPFQSFLTGFSVLKHSFSWLFWVKRKLKKHGGSHMGVRQGPFQSFLTGFSGCAQCAQCARARTKVYVSVRPLKLTNSDLGRIVLGFRVGEIVQLELQTREIV